MLQEKLTQQQLEDAALPRAGGARWGSAREDKGSVRSYARDVQERQQKQAALRGGKHGGINILTGAPLFSKTNPLSSKTSEAASVTSEIKINYANNTINASTIAPNAAPSNSPYAATVNTAQLPDNDHFENKRKLISIHLLYFVVYRWFLWVLV
jgi:hypothetical protein